MKRSIFAVLAVLLSMVILTGCSALGGNNGASKGSNKTENGSKKNSDINVDKNGASDIGNTDRQEGAKGSESATDSTDSSEGLDSGNGGHDSVNVADTAQAADASQNTDSVTVTDGVDDEDSNSTESGTSGEGAADANKNVVVVIDPGHGGIYPGAEHNSRIEKNLTLIVSKYVRDILVNGYDGIEVYLTRDTDVTLDKDLKLDLEMRAICAEEHNADALVSIHFNASNKHNMNGTTVFISRREQVNKACYDLASSIMDSFVALGLKNCGIESRKSNDMFDETGDPYDYYAINRHCAARNIPGIIVEQCFMDNETDYAYFSSDEALYALAMADATGIANYFNLTRKH